MAMLRAGTPGDVAMLRAGAPGDVAMLRAGAPGDVAMLRVCAPHGVAFRRGERAGSERNLLHVQDERSLSDSEEGVSTGVAILDIEAILQRLTCSKLFMGKL